MSAADVMRVSTTSVVEKTPCEKECPGLDFIPLSSSSRRAVYVTDEDIKVMGTIDDELSELGFTPVEKYYASVNGVGGEELIYVKAISPFGGLAFIKIDTPGLPDPAQISYQVSPVSLDRMTVFEPTIRSLESEEMLDAMTLGGVVAECEGSFCRFSRGSHGSMDHEAFSQSPQRMALRENSLLYPTFNLSDLKGGCCSKERMMKATQCVNLAINHRMVCILEKRAKTVECLLLKSDMLQNALIDAAKNLKDVFKLLDSLNCNFQCASLDSCTAKKKAEFIQNYHVRGNLYADLFKIYNETANYDVVIERLGESFDEIRQKLCCVFNKENLYASRIV